MSRARALAADWVSSSPRLFSASAWPRLAVVVEHFQRLLVAGGGCLVVPGQPLHDAQLIAVVGLVDPVAESAQERWRAVNAPHLVALVRAGARFERGQLI